MVTGTYTHIGCLMTAADAFQRDIQAFLVADAVADLSAEERRRALERAVAAARWYSPPSGRPDNYSAPTTPGHTDPGPDPTLRATAILTNPPQPSGSSAIPDTLRPLTRETTEEAVAALLGEEPADICDDDDSYCSARTRSA